MFINRTVVLSGIVLLLSTITDVTYAGGYDATFRIVVIGSSKTPAINFKSTKFVDKPTIDCTSASSCSFSVNLQKSNLYPGLTSFDVTNDKGAICPATLALYPGTDQNFKSAKQASVNFQINPLCKVTLSGNEYTSNYTLTYEGSSFVVVPMKIPQPEYQLFKK